MELKSGGVVGLEALIRWNHPTRGMMLPATFVPMAKTTGSIVPIRDGILDACAELTRVNLIYIKIATRWVRNLK
jgi:EAL domain-containing protein (putative c-di-GMP-specific phosphodiesterase class I)